jgi:hypothetical protein
MIKICKVYKLIENFVVWLWDMRMIVFYQILALFALIGIYEELKIYNTFSDLYKLAVIVNVILFLILQCLIVDSLIIRIDERIED